MNTPTVATAAKLQKMTRRTSTTKAFRAMLAECTAAAKAAGVDGSMFNAGEEFEVYGNEGHYPSIKLSGCDTHGPVRCGAAFDPSDFEACRAALPVVERFAAQFSNCKVSNHGRSITLDFSGVEIWPSTRENRD